MKRAAPKNYDEALGELLRQAFGHLVQKCPQCQWPCLKAWVCSCGHGKDDEAHQ